MVAYPEQHPGLPRSAPATPSWAWARHRFLRVGAPFLLLVVIHTALALMRDRPLIFADEAGYIGNARFLAGGLPIVLFKSGTYNAGYSLLLAPLFWLGMSPEHTYQGILVLNGVLLSTCYVTLLQWLRSALAANEALACGIAFVTSLYPSFMVQPLFAMSESAIIAISCALPLSVYKLVENKRVASGVTFALLVSYLYAVHPRYTGTIGLSALSLAALALARTLPWRTVFPSLATLAVGYLGARQLVSWVNAANRGHTINGEAKLVSLTTAQGIGAFLVEAVGQFWYLLVASAGFAIIGVVVILVRLLRHSPDEARHASPAWNAFFFVTCNAAIAFGIAVLFMAAGTRVDHFIYGRYNEGLVAPFIATGLWASTRVASAWWAIAVKILAVSASMTLLGALVLWLRGTALNDAPNLANILAILPQLGLLSGSNLLGVSLIGAGIYALAATASCWRPWLGLALVGASFATIGYYSQSYFQRMQRGRERVQALFEPIAQMPEVTHISYDGTYFNPVVAFFGQYFLPNIEFDMFHSGKGQAPTSRFILSSKESPDAASRSDLVISQDKRNVIWDMGACCPRSDSPYRFLGAQRVDGVAERGFYDTETWPIGAVRWTNGEAGLSIPLSGGSLEGSNLYVDIASVGPKANRVEFSANGVELFRGRLRKGRTRLMLPLDGIVVGDTLELTIKSKTFSPQDDSSSADTRQLGVSIRKISIIRECCIGSSEPGDPRGD